MNGPGILSRIADMYGITSKTVLNRIKEHPELGIKVGDRRATELDDNQMQQLCAILDARYTRKAALPDVPAEPQDGEFSQSFASLKSELAQVRTDLEVERARSEERLKQLVYQNERIPLLEAAAEEREREASKLREQISEMRVEAAEREAEMRIKAAELAAARDEWKSKGFWDRVFKR